MTTEKDDDHGKSQAKAQYESISEMVAALDLDWDRLEELREERDDLQKAVGDATEAAERPGDWTNEQEAVYRTDYYDKHGEMPPDTAGALREARDALKKWEEENAAELAELEEAADGYDDADDARQRIQDDALSVEVRSGWGSPGATLQAEEFCILLCTGGPAVQIRGELNEHGEPSRAWMEYQDWGTPWTQYFDTDQDVLLSYCRCFYFGEG